jgi:hypothetical protein
MKWAIPLLFAVALMGCGDDSTPSATGSTPASDAGSDRAVQFSECMRKNGVPEFPDPENGRIMLRGGPGSGLDPSSPEFQAAQEACRHLMPEGGQAGGGNNEQLQQRVLEYAQCMRENGVPEFPDPDVSGGTVQMRTPPGVDPNSRQFQAAQQACQDLLAGP